MIRKRLPLELAPISAAVTAKHGNGFRYVHTVDGFGPDGKPGTVDVFTNDAENWDDRRDVMVLNGEVLGAQ